jgi:uncharacterized protein YidB (DUF937 family)
MMAAPNFAQNDTVERLVDPEPVGREGNPAEATAPGDAEAIIRSFLIEADQQIEGFAGLLQQMRNNGLGDHLSRWATGTSQEATEHDVQQGLGQTVLSSIATRASVEPAVAQRVLSQVLPQIVQRAAPGGTPIAPQVGSHGEEIARQIATNVASGNYSLSR